MFALGHLGLGKKVATPLYRRFDGPQRRAFFVGALLPDLIDKPLFYLPFWWSGRDGAAARILSGTHLFAHTGLFLLLLLLAARLRHSLVIRALAVGVATHFFLDGVGLSMGFETLLWPLLGWRFPAYPFGGLGQHLSTILSPVTLGGELLGGLALAWDFRARRRRRHEQAVALPGDAEMNRLI